MCGTTLLLDISQREANDLRNYKKLKIRFLAGAILIVLTLSFAQVAFYEPATMIRTFTIADQENLPTRGNPGMVYDNESDLIVIFGGWNETAGSPWDTTWTYDYNSDTYTKMDPATSPLGRAEPGICYDSIRDEVMIFAGEDGMDTPDALNDSWIYDVDSDTWTEVFPTTAPSDRRAHSMAFDSESNRIIVFGGLPDYGNDTWAGEPTANTFIEMNPATAPEGRTGAIMVYDSESDRMILFGGYNGEGSALPSSYLDDTWSYDFNTDTWEELTTTGSPSARGVPSMVYDSESDRIVLFGGSIGSESYNDTWLFDYNSLTWTEVTPTGSPSVRSRHSSAYDWESDRVIIYGGTYNGFNGLGLISETQGKTWAYDVNTNTWERMDGLDEPGPPPLPDWLFILVVVGGIGVVLILVIVFVRRK